MTPRKVGPRCPAPWARWVIEDEGGLIPNSPRQFFPRGLPPCFVGTDGEKPLMQAKTCFMLKRLDIPFGYNQLLLGTVTVHTGKIRVKTDHETVRDFMYKEQSSLYCSAICGRNNCIIVSWTTTSIEEHNEFIQRMNRLLAYVMHKRIAYKYGEIIEPVVELEW